MAIFDVVSMLIMWSVINGSIGWRMYAYKQFEINTRNAKILVTEYFNLLNLKQNRYRHDTLHKKPVLIHSVDYTTHTMMLRHAVWNVHVEVNEFLIYTSGKWWKRPWRLSLWTESVISALYVGEKIEQPWNCLRFWCESKCVKIHHVMKFWCFLGGKFF
jgi:hypothetical protein